MYIFVLVIVTILIVAGLIAVMLSVFNEDVAKDNAYAGRLQSYLSAVKNESAFYFTGNNNSYAGLSLDYFKNNNIIGSDIVTGVSMDNTSWTGFPAGISSATSYIKTPKEDKVRIVLITDPNDTNAFYLVQIIKNDASASDNASADIYERALSNAEGYEGL